MKKQPSDLFDKAAANLSSGIQYIASLKEKLQEKLYRVYGKIINLNHPIARILRLDKPAPIFLAMAPAWWVAAFIASNAFHIILFCLFFLIGAAIMRGAGCVINDIIDRKLDAKVERTKNRPLANGDLSIKYAIYILCITLMLALGLLLTLPQVAIAIGLLTLIPIMVYPWMKRITYYPQIMLGLVYNAGALIAWAAIKGTLSWPAFLIYFAAALWTIGYDTLYAYQDIDDDLHCGIKSTAIKFSNNGPSIVWGLYQFSILLLCIAGLNLHMNFLFYIVIAIATYHLNWQAETVDLKNAKDCGAKFKSNVGFALLVFLGILLGRI